MGGVNSGNYTRKSSDGMTFAQFLDLQRRRIRKRLFRAEEKDAEELIELLNDGMSKRQIMREGDYEYRR